MSPELARRSPRLTTDVPFSARPQVVDDLRTMWALSTSGLVGCLRVQPISVDDVEVLTWSSSLYVRI